MTFNLRPWIITTQKIYFIIFAFLRELWPYCSEGVYLFLLFCFFLLDKNTGEETLCDLKDK